MSAASHQAFLDELHSRLNAEAQSPGCAPERGHGSGGYDSREGRWERIEQKFSELFSGQDFG